MQFFRALLYIFVCLSFFQAGAQSGEVQTNLSTLKQYRPLHTEVETNRSTVERSSAILIGANDDCSGGVNLTVNGGCYTDSTNGASVQVGENALPCGTSTFTQTMWYRFTATATNMWVQLNSLRYSGSGATWGPSAWAAAVYRSNTCLPSTAPIACANSNTQGSGDGVIELILSNLTVGATYFVQVGYRTGSGINLIPTYCIQVGDQFTPVCNTCINPCGPACGFTTTPTVSQVTSTCPPYQQRPVIEGAVADTQCYTFYAVNTTVSFNVIVNSTCGSGNVTGFTWNLYSSACGAPIQSGTLSNLTFTGLVIGQQYRYCYSFTTPSNCYHTAYYPYFVGASPLPVDLLSFTGEECEKGVCLEWTTASEVNNERFILERSADGINYVKIATLNGQGTITHKTEYSYEDESVVGTELYYRLSQVDFDGTAKEYTPILVKLHQHNFKFVISPNPAKENAEIILINPSASSEGNISVYDLSGKTYFEKNISIQKGLNTFSLPLHELQNGIYHVRVLSDKAVSYQKLEVIH